MSGDDAFLEEMKAEIDASEDPVSGNSIAGPPVPFGSSDESMRVGHVTVQDESIILDREDDGDTHIAAFIDSDEREAVRLGNYIRIPYAPDGPEDISQKMLFGVIERLEYHSVTDIRDKQDGGYRNDPGEQSFAYVGTIDPISVVEYDRAGDPDDPLERSTVDQPPKPGASVYLVEDENFLCTGLQMPTEGVFMGDMAVSGDVIPDEDNPLAYNLFNPNATDGNGANGEPAIFRHTQVAGSTGSGKTHASKNNIRQLVSGKEYTIEVPPEERDRHGIDQDERVRGLNCTIIDPENEYVQMRDGNPDLPDSVRNEYENRGINTGGFERDPEIDCDVYVPQVAGTNEPNIDGAREFAIPFALARFNKQLLYAASPGGRTRQAINDTIDIYFGELDDWMEATYEAFSDRAAELLDPDSTAITDQSSVKTAARERLVDRTEYHRIFDQCDRTLFDLTGRMFEPHTVTVVPTGHLRGSIDRLVVSCLLAHIVKNKIGSDVLFPQIKGTPMLLALDEAHEYLSSTDDPREGTLVRNFRQAAKRGRKDLFGLYLITQTPQDIDEEVRKQMNTRIYLGLERNVVESHDVYVPKEFESQVTQFSKGQAVIKQPDVRAVEIRGLPYCLTKHE